jgi:hypothetical protein
VTSESKHLIAALHNILIKLELTDAPGRDEESFAQLKRIIKQRIQDLENPAPITSRTPRGVKAAD